MKKIFLLPLLACAVLELCGCYNGKGHCSNPPLFSPNPLNFDANGGNGIITSNNSHWSISSISINDTCSYGGGIYECGLKEAHETLCSDDCPPGYPKICPTLFVHCGTEFKFEGEWFNITVTKTGEYGSPRELTFEVKPNDTGESRKLKLCLEGMNCFVPDLVITQTAE